MGSGVESGVSGGHGRKIPAGTHYLGVKRFREPRKTVHLQAVSYSAIPSLWNFQRLDRIGTIMKKQNPERARESSNLATILDVSIFE